MEEKKYYLLYKRKTKVAELFDYYDQKIIIDKKTNHNWNYIIGNKITFKYYKNKYYYRFNNCSIEYKYIDEIIEKLKKIKGISNIVYYYGENDDDDEWDDLL